MGMFSGKINWGEEEYPLIEPEVSHGMTSGEWKEPTEGYHSPVSTS